MVDPFRAPPSEFGQRRFNTLKVFPHGRRMKFTRPSRRTRAFAIAPTDAGSRKRSDRLSSIT